VSKANTAAQIVLAALVLGELAFSVQLGPLRTALILLTGVLTVASAAAYLVAWLRHMSGYGEGSRTSNSQIGDIKSGNSKSGSSNTDA